MNQNRQATESHEQRLLVEWLRLQGIGFFAVPNSARRDARNAARLKAEGMRAGVPDLIFTRRFANGQPVALELKTKKGRLSNSQREVIREMESEGWIVLVAFGLEDAVKKVRDTFGRPRSSARKALDF